MRAFGGLRSTFGALLSASASAHAGSIASPELPTPLRSVDLQKWKSELKPSDAQRAAMEQAFDACIDAWQRLRDGNVRPAEAQFDATNAAERRAQQKDTSGLAATGLSTSMSTRAGGNEASLTQSQRVAQMRAAAAEDRNMRRFNELMSGRQFRSAARTEERAERAANDILAAQQMRDTMGKMFDGAGNIGEAVRNFENEARVAGMTPDQALGRMGVERGVGESRRDALKRFLEEQSMPEEQRRAQEQQRGGQGGSGQRDKQSGVLEAIQSLVEQFKASMEERLPQTVMAD